MFAGAWTPNQQNRILFVLVDSNGTEVTGLGSTFTLQLTKNDAGFSASAGTKSEIGLGWYSYLSTAAEADTIGPIGIVVTHASIVQQNLEYVVQARNSEAITFTYTVYDAADGTTPIPGVTVSVWADEAMTQFVTSGVTDASGEVEFELDPDTYYFKNVKVGVSFTNPDTEVVSL